MVDETALCGVAARLPAVGVRGSRVDRDGVPGSRPGVWGMCLTGVRQPGIGLTGVHGSLSRRDMPECLSGVEAARTGSGELWDTMLACRSSRWPVVDVGIIGLPSSESLSVVESAVVTLCGSSSPSVVSPSSMKRIHFFFLLSNIHYSHQHMILVWQSQHSKHDT